jgi:COP9 signalosome complex subunit 7
MHAALQILPYSTLLECLDLQGVRALEDFIIQQCIYSDILKCKLDQVNSCVHVLSVLQRDVRPEELPMLSRGLEEMCVLCCACTLD